MSSNFSDINTAGVFTRRLWKNRIVQSSIGYKAAMLKPAARHAKNIDLVIGWGRKKQSLKAREYARKHGVPYLALEDGFIHSMSQGRLGATSWSLVKDELGIYYDATSVSGLEQIIASRDLTDVERQRAKQCILQITSRSITKYNNAKRQVPDYIKNLIRPILVVDQVKGDMSIPYSLASECSFNEMLDAAKYEHPDSDIIIKIHPDVVLGRRKGCIRLPKDLPANVYIVSDNVNSIELLRHMEKVYTVSSQMGFEALMMKTPVVCFGVPFYAGWGLTDDRLDASLEVYKRRAKQVDLYTVFFSAYIDYSCYFHPETYSPCELEEILNFVELQYVTQESGVGVVFCIGFSPWKKRFIKYYLKTPDNDVIFVNSAEEAKQKGVNASCKVCIWSSRFESEAELLNRSFGVPILRIEDGFIRSVSLGSNYAPPCSLVIDKSGLYFDPSKPSDLEIILSNTCFSEEQLATAEKIRIQIIEKSISKYNVGVRGVPDLFSRGEGRRKILVPGQVSDDASILKGCKGIRDNASLLKLVKSKNPEAFIIYKPHPDVLSGNRNGFVDERIVSACADQVVEEVSMPDCLAQVDEVHTMTSLVGFEALMRGLPVYCYGMPFYAGWGLTQDQYECSRRQRDLLLDELVAGTLLVYPKYMNWETKAFSDVSFIVNQLYQRLQSQGGSGRKTTDAQTKISYFTKKYNLLKVLVGSMSD